MEWLKALYVAATIFGVGVTAADLIGVFANIGSGEGEGDGDSDDDGGGEIEGDAELDGGSDDGSESESEDEGDGEGSIVAHDQRHRRNPVLALLSALRTSVYFALGFGPVGWFATTQYPSAAITLAWSVPVGLLVAAGTRALRALMKRDLTSEITREDLIMERGVVTVSIGPGEIGKVRIKVGSAYVDRFAKAESPTALRAGAAVRVVDSDDEYVYVEPDEERSLTGIQ